MNDYLDLTHQYTNDSQINFLRFLCQLYVIKYLEEENILTESLCERLKYCTMTLKFFEDELEILDPFLYGEFFMELFIHYGYHVSLNHLYPEQQEELFSILPAPICDHLKEYDWTECEFIYLLESSKTDFFYNAMRTRPLIFTEEIMSICGLIKEMVCAFPGFEWHIVHYKHNTFLYTLGSIEQIEEEPDNVNYSVLYSLIDLDNLLVNFINKYSEEANHECA